MVTGLRETQGTAHSEGFVRVSTSDSGNTRPSGQPDRGGRRQSISSDFWPEVLRLRESGLGYLRIARELERLGSMDL